MRSADDMHAVVETALSWFAGCSSMLDVGCSNGNLLGALTAARPSLSACGIDLDSGRIAMARRAGVRADFHVGDANLGLPYAEASFDAVSCVEVIEHVESPCALLEEIARVLIPGGRLLLTTPNANALARVLMRDQWYALADPTHLIFQTPFTLRFLLERNALHIEELSTRSSTRLRLYDRLVERLLLGGQLVVLATRQEG